MQNADRTLPSKKAMNKGAYPVMAVLVAAIVILACMAPRASSATVKAIEIQTEEGWCRDVFTDGTLEIRFGIVNADTYVMLTNYGKKIIRFNFPTDSLELPGDGRKTVVYLADFRFTSSMNVVYEEKSLSDKHKPEVVNPWEEKKKPTFSPNYVERMRPLDNPLFIPSGRALFLKIGLTNRKPVYESLGEFGVADYKRFYESLEGFEKGASFKWNIEYEAAGQTYSRVICLRLSI